MKLLFTIAALFIALSINAQSTELRYDVDQDKLYFGESNITLEGLINLTKAQGFNGKKAKIALRQKRNSRTSIKANALKFIGGVAGAGVGGYGCVLVAFAGYGGWFSGGDSGTRQEIRRQENQGYGLIILSAPLLVNGLTINTKKGYERRYKINIQRAVNQYNASLLGLL
tara:strand:+ start:649 stop:1158 length:510 start_codon:yes stop_codon:yes gene_type:complete